MKPFDLEKAKAGAPLCTRDGRPARIVCWDVENESQGSLLALVRNDFNEESPYLYNGDGEYEAGEKHYLDLFLAPTKHEGWVNVYNVYESDGRMYHHVTIHDTKADADAIEHSSKLACVRIEWEE